MNNENRKNKMSFIDFFVYLIVKVKNDDIFALGAQLAYYLILSFFPFIIFLITLIGFSDLNSIEVLEGLRAILPLEVFKLIDRTVIEIVDTQNTGLLGMSIVLTIWASSTGFRAVIKGVNKAYNIKESRSFMKRALVAVFFTFMLALIIMLALAMLVFGDIIGKYMVGIFPFDKVIKTIWDIGRYLIVVFVMTWIFACIYRYTPCRKIRWKEVYIGAIFSTVGWILVSLGFSYYINNIANYSRLYGSLGAVIMLMTWLYLSSIILILGAEINSVISLKKKIY